MTKDTLNQRQAIDWERMFITHLINRIYKELPSFNKEEDTPGKNRQRFVDLMEYVIAYYFISADIRYIFIASFFKAF